MTETENTEMSTQSGLTYLRRASRSLVVNGGPEFDFLMFASNRASKTITTSEREAFHADLLAHGSAEITLRVEVYEDEEGESRLREQRAQDQICDQS